MKNVTSSQKMALLLTTFISSTVLAEPKDHRMIQFQTEVSRSIANDEMQATLYAELTDKNANVLANKINQLMNKSIKLIKQHPQIQVHTGQQHTYPVYNDKNQISQWRSRAEIRLSSADFKVTSEVIAQLQQDLKLANVDFAVSKAQRERVENELYGEVSKAFQQRAKSLLTAWNAQRYELVNLNINTADQYYARPMAAMAMSSKRATADTIETQNFEAGNSEIRMTAQGSIQLSD